MYNDPNQPYPQWGQQPPPPPPQFPMNPGYPQTTQPGQFGPPPNQQVPQKPPKPPLFDYKARRAYYKQYPLSKKQNLAIGCGTLIGVLLLCGVCSAIANAGNSTQQPAAAQVSSPIATQAQSTQEPTQAPTSTPAPVLTQAPTQPPVQQSVQQQQSAQQQPAQQPATTGVNGNPWGYDFNPGSYIYSPPSAFCEYFDCIASFWNGKGYVEECSDATYSKSGGISGSCSRHGGDYRPLYSH
jgi:hypothetical protein